MKAVIKYLRDLYSGPFQATLVFSFTLVAAITVGIGTWVISRTINNYLSNAMEERIARDIQLANTFYKQRLNGLANTTLQLSLDPTVINNLEFAIKGDRAAIAALNAEIGNRVSGLASGGDHYIAILDQNGRVVVDALVTSNGQQTQVGTHGDWSGLPIVQNALTRQTLIASTEIIPQEYLKQVRLDEQAYIQLLETPKAAPQPYDPREGTAGLALFSIAPIFNPGGQLHGAAIAFHLFNNDFTLVDQIKEAAQIDTVTIFLGDLRVSTNVKTETGQRAVGTRLSKEVADVVLREGREYVGTAFVVTQNYITRYEPLTDHTGQVIGILYVGALQSSFMDLVNTLNQQIILVATLTILMTFILTTPVARSITRPLQELRELVKTSQRVAEGDLNARAPVTAGGEVGLVARSFNSMLDTLQSTQDQLVHSEKLASLGQLAAGVAHELNNPLAAILLYAETMMKEHHESDPEYNDFRIIISETKRCKRIVSDLLNFARQNQVVAQPTDIHAILHELLEIAPRRIKTVQVDFVTDLDPNLPLIEADPSQLRQVLLNLMTNAVEAMPEGGTVTLRTRTAPPGMITIEVQDTGVGIPPENLSKLFTPFFTTKPIGKGTGLGLAIVYGIIKMHRGQISATSKVNKGTTFTITLPIHQPTLERAITTNNITGSTEDKVLIG